MKKLTGPRVFVYALYIVALATAPLRASLVTNGGFETGDFTGWAEGGETAWNGVISAVCPNSFGFVVECTPHTGAFASYLGPIHSISTLTQSIATDPGATYDLDFWVRLQGQTGSNFPGTPNEFEVMWNGATLTDIVNTADLSWEHMIFKGLAATSSSTDLTFGLFDVPNWIGLDDVNVTATPEPATMSLLGLGVALAAVLRSLRARLVGGASIQVAQPVASNRGKRWPH
jgi:hypothetical protein